MNAIPSRDEIAQKDKWDLSKLYPSPEAWEAGLKSLEETISGAAKFRGTLGEKKETLIACLQALKETAMLSERLNYYADLRQTEDEGLGESRDRSGRFLMASSKSNEAWSFFEPELLSLPEGLVETWMQAPEFSEYRVYLSRITRMKPHVLSEREERLLALQAETFQTPSEAFSVLANVDMQFGTIATKDGERPLSNGSWMSFMQNPDRKVREAAYRRYYGEYDKNKNTLAALYSGSVQQDRYLAKVRNFASARERALFPDNVGETVYDNLISTVSENLKPLHDYFSLKKKLLGLDTLRHWDVSATITGNVTVRTTWDEAVEKIIKALAPLGDEYCSTLKAGLASGWADKYENKGKRSGAFSAGSYSGDPYILMNYYEDNIRDLFTLAHEAGHSMHSWYSARVNPFMHYNYTIFEAEVASTFNEELLFRHLMGETRDRDLKAYLVSKRIEDIYATLFRQTMFAEFEARSHALTESGTPLTLDVLRTEYRKLQEKYFGPEMKFEDVSDLECLRIPHFYNAFYVYKYSTGISASLALAERVLSGGDRERNDYFAFLKSGGSRFPIDSLKVAGVDMSSKAPVQAACARFGALVAELNTLL